MSNCLFCGKKLVNNQTKYCSNQCQADYLYKKYIQDWQNKKETGRKSQYQLSNYVRKYMLEKADFKCQNCGWGEQNPFTGLVPLEIHHKNGNYENSWEENLEVLCPNCHALTENFRSRGRGRVDRKQYYMTNTCIDCGKSIANTSTRCADCSTKHQKEKRQKMLPVTKTELKGLIREYAFTAIGRQFNVTAGTIRQWCKNFDLPATKTEINKYNDDDWELL